MDNSNEEEDEGDGDGDNRGGKRYQLLNTDNAPGLLYIHFLMEFSPWPYELVYIVVTILW